MEEKFITITGFKHYYGHKPFIVGNLLKLVKEPTNHYDTEAIKAVMPFVGTIGYVANSPETVAGGTMSAGRIYDHVNGVFYARVMFTTYTKIICMVEQRSIEELEREMVEKSIKTYEDDECSTKNYF